MKTTNTAPDNHLSPEIIEELKKVGKQLFISEELVINKEILIEIKLAVLKIIDKITFNKIQRIKKFRKTTERFRNRIEKLKQIELEETSVVKRFISKHNQDKLTPEQKRIIVDTYENARDNRIEATLITNNNLSTL